MIGEREEAEQIHSVLGRGAGAVDVDALVASASEALRMHALDSAVSILKGALAIQPGHARGWALLGRVYERQGRLDQAKEAYEEAIEIDDTDLHAGFALAGLYAKAGDADGAIALLIHVIKNVEDDPELLKRASALKRSLEQKKQGGKA